MICWTDGWKEKAMDNKNYQQGIKLLLKAGLNYQKKPSEEQLSVWYDFLKNIDNNSWYKVIQYWIKNNENFPTIAGLLKVYDEMTTERVNIRQEIEKSQFGREYIDPNIRKAVMRCGGFERIGNMTEQQAVFALKDIEKEYKEILKEESFNNIKYLEEENVKRIDSKP